MSLLVLNILNVESDCGCTQKYLMDQTFFPKQTINHIVTAYYKQGIVELRENKNNRREKIVCLTPAGKDYAGTILPPLDYMSKIIVVGCGNMVSNLVRAFMEGGHCVSIVDLKEETAKSFVEKGAAYHKSLQDAGNADLIVLNLVNIDIVKSVINSVDAGYLKGKLVLNTTTAIALP